MRPGLSRAIPMGFLGFIVGALIVIILRGLQGLDPLWAPGPGIIMTVIMSAVFFVWGIGAFDPRLSVHGDEEVEQAVEKELEEESAQPRSILMSWIWKIATILIFVTFIIGGFAWLPGGLALTQTIQPGASLTMVGFATVPLPFGGPEVQVSTLVIFALFVIWVFVSLIVFSGLIAWAVTSISHGLVTTKVAAAAGGGTAALPAPGEGVQPKADNRGFLIALGKFVIALILLYVAFHVILGVVISEPSFPVLSWFMDAAGQLTFLAFVGALLVAGFLLRPPTGVLVFVFTFIILYYFFYYVAIGLIIPEPDMPGLSLLIPPGAPQLAFLSAVNALIFTFVILKTELVLQTVGRVARWLANVLRSVPKFLQ